jgi:hypothetical protein
LPLIPLEWHDKQSEYPSKPCCIVGAVAVAIEVDVDVEIGLEAVVEVEAGVPD